MCEQVTQRNVRSNMGCASECNCLQDVDRRATSRCLSSDSSLSCRSSGNSCNILCGGAVEWNGVGVWGLRDEAGRNGWRMACAKLVGWGGGEE